MRRLALFYAKLGKGYAVVEKLRTKLKFLINEHTFFELDRAVLVLGYVLYLHRAVLACNFLSDRIAYLESKLTASPEATAYNCGAMICW